VLSKQQAVTKDSTEREIKLYLRDICISYKKGDIDLEELSRRAGNVMYSVFTPKSLSKRVSGELIDFIWMLDEHYYYSKKYSELKKKFQRFGR